MSYTLDLHTEPGLRTTWWAPSEGYKPGEPRWWLMWRGQRVRPATAVEIELWIQAMSYHKALNCAVTVIEKQSECPMVPGMV